MLPSRHLKVFVSLVYTERRLGGTPLTDAAQIELADKNKNRHAQPVAVRQVDAKPLAE